MSFCMQMATRCILLHRIRRLLERHPGRHYAAGLGAAGPLGRGCKCADNENWCGAAQGLPGYGTLFRPATRCSIWCLGRFQDQNSDLS